jgi:hypothetical protein
LRDTAPERRERRTAANADAIPRRVPDGGVRIASVPAHGWANALGLAELAFHVFDLLG